MVRPLMLDIDGGVWNCTSLSFEVVIVVDIALVRMKFSLGNMKIVRGPFMYSSTSLAVCTGHCP
jgi:hypothetical protein